MDAESKILIVDDHPSFVEGVSLLLQSIIPNTKPLVAHNAIDALALAKQHPDLDWVFLDINMPDMSGIELVERFNKNKLLANIVVMTSENSPVIIDQALKKNVSGFLTKDFDRKTLSDSITAIEKGIVFLIPEHARQLKNYRESLLLEKQLIEENISERQRQTLLLVAEGYSNQEIASNLGITESTVKTHVSSLIALFEADNRTHCVAEARRLHVVD